MLDLKERGHRAYLAEYYLLPRPSACSALLVVLVVLVLRTSGPTTPSSRSLCTPRSPRSAPAPLPVLLQLSVLF